MSTTPSDFVLWCDGRGTIYAIPRDRWLDRFNKEVVDCEEETSDSTSGLEGLEVLQEES